MTANDYNIIIKKIRDQNGNEKVTFEIGIPCFNHHFETSLYNVPMHISLLYINGMVGYNQYLRINLIKLIMTFIMTMLDR